MLLVKRRQHFTTSDYYIRFPVFSGGGEHVGPPGSDLVTSSLDSHNFHLHQSTEWPLMPSGWGIIILEDTAPIRIDVSPPRQRWSLRTNCYWFAVTLSSQGTSGPKALAAKCPHTAPRCQQLPSLYGPGFSCTSIHLYKLVKVLLKTYKGYETKKFQRVHWCWS